MKCKICGKEIERGIFNQIEHQEVCKEIPFTDDEHKQLGKEIGDLIDDLSKKRKGNGEFSYKTDGVVEKVVTDGFTTWGPHGSLDKAMKEEIDDSIILKGRRGNWMIGTKNKRNEKK